MVDPQLVKYVKEQMGKGQTEIAVRQVALGSGWPEKDVEKAIVQAKGEGSAGMAAGLLEMESAKSMGAGKKWWWLILGLAVGLVIVGSVVGFAWINPSPEKVLGQMIEAVTEVETQRYQGEVVIMVEEAGEEMLLTSGAEQLQELKVEFAGKSEMGKIDEARSQVDLTITGWEQIPFLVEFIPQQVEWRQFGVKFYLTVKDAGQGRFWQTMLKKWLFVDMEALAKKYGVDVTEDLEALRESEEKGQKIEDLWRNNPPINITGTLPNQEIAGMSTWGYTWDLDKDKYRELMKQQMLVLSPEYVEQVEDEESGRMFDEINDVTVSGELWVGKRDKLPYKVEATIVPTMNSDYAGAGTIRLSLTFSDYNQPVDIEVPKDNIMGVEEFIDELVKSMMSEVQVDGEQAAIAQMTVDSDADGIPDQMEALYGTDLNNPDTDGDGYADREEIVNGYDPLSEGRLQDRDGDALPDELEIHFGTDPDNPDTDGDGYEDGIEIMVVKDPRNP